MGDAVAALNSPQNIKIDGRSERRQEQEVNAVSKNPGGLCLLIRLMRVEQKQQTTVFEVIFTGCQEQHSAKWPHTKDMLGESQCSLILCVWGAGWELKSMGLVTKDKGKCVLGD